MQEAHKADLTFIHQEMAAAAAALREASQRLGVPGFIDYANRVTVYVERCKTMLDADEDFTEYEPHNDALSRLEAAEAHQEVLRRELAALQAAQPAPSATVDATAEQLERAAYARVERELRQLDLWVASYAGSFVSNDVTLLEAVREIRARREQVALVPPKVRATPVATPTTFPQSFEVPHASGLTADPVEHPPYPFTPMPIKKEDP